MTSTPDNAVAPVTPNEGGLPFQIFQTSQSHITCHTIFDYELDRLVNISRPLTVGVATLLIGAALGLLPSVLDIAELAKSGQITSLSKLFLLFVFGMSLAGGGVCGFFALRGQKDANDIRADVRARTAIPITPPSNTGNSAGATNTPRKRGKAGLGGG